MYTVFVLSCQGGGVVWHVSRRYSEFAELHLKLLALLPAAKGGASRARAALIARMPAKVYLGATAPEVVKHRLDLLTSYVLIVQRTLLQHGGADDPNPHASGQSSSPTPPSPPSWVTQACKVWQQFCAVPSTAFAAAALARSAQQPLAARPSSPPVTTRLSSPTGGGGGGAGQLRSVLRRGPKAKTNKKVRLVLECATQPFEHKWLTRVCYRLRLKKGGSRLCGATMASCRLTRVCSSPARLSALRARSLTSMARPSW